MRYAGKITEWDDERGFGFVVPNGGGERAFLHVRSVRRTRRRPVVGDLVTWEATKDAQGRLQAHAVDFVSLRNARPAREAGDSRWPRAATGASVLILIALAYLSGKLPAAVALAFGVFSALSFMAYWKDKVAAKHGTWRTPEQSLHLLDFLDGWPGGLIAQQLFHHKTVKQSFQVGFWFSVVANVIAIRWLVKSGVAAELTAMLGD